MDYDAPADQGIRVWLDWARAEMERAKGTAAEEELRAFALMIRDVELSFGPSRSIH